MSMQLLEHPSPSLAFFDRRDELRDAGHEQVVFARDRRTGLQAIVAIHDTTLGPGLGGTRFYPYANEALAMTDVLRLSEGMTYKAAAANMPLGGAKAVIIGDPGVLRTDALLEAYGNLVESLGGRYYTAADVGTTAEDLDVIGRSTRYVVGRSRELGGSGDSGYSTALGVFSALRAAAAAQWGDNGLADRLVGVEGVGKVGRHLVDLLLSTGARVVVSDRDPRPLESYAAHDRVAVATDVVTEKLDVYAPCALGGTLSPASVEVLSASIVCGAANNQLEHRGVAELLRTRSIQWVPDYVANGGGLIQVGSELLGTSADLVEEKVRQIENTARELLHLAVDLDITTWEAARRLVNTRLLSARSAGTQAS